MYHSLFSIIIFSDYPHLLNYLTAPDVVIWSAAVASCSIPGVFAPGNLFKKVKKALVREGEDEYEIIPCSVPGVKYADGSIEADLPIERIKEMFNINHFIVSQVNPHARLLAPHSTLNFYGYMPSALAYISEKVWTMQGRYVIYIPVCGMHIYFLVWLCFFEIKCEAGLNMSQILR